jgi:hypothetical protein
LFDELFDFRFQLCAKEIKISVHFNLHKRSILVK